MGTLLQDLRFLARSALKNPGYTLVLIAVLSLGIAATGSVSSVVRGVLLHDLPYPQPDRILLLTGVKTENGASETFLGSYPDVQDWRTQSTSFQDFGVHSPPMAFNLASDGDPERVSGEIVDSGFFRVFGVEPLLGRGFTAADDGKPGAPRIALVGHALWQRRFGNDHRIDGKSLIVDGESYQVAGVMPARFKGASDQSEIWLPLMMSGDILGDPRFLDLDRRNVRWLTGVARLAPGVSATRAQRDLDRISTALGREYPDTNEHMRVEARTLAESLFGDLRLPLLTLLGASAFVLLIAWTTVTNLLLASATARQSEITVRAALGATRPRLVRQLLTESLALSGVSCAVGLLLAHWTTDALVAASALKFPSFVEIGLDLPVVGAVAVVSLLCGAGFGLAPAWLGVRRALVRREAANSRGFTHQRFQSSLVVAEVALALFLLLGAGLLIRGFQRLQATAIGFRPDNLLTVRVDLKGKRYADVEVMTRLARQYCERLQALPGVASASILSPTLPTDSWIGSSFIVEDLRTATEDGVVFLVYHYVSPGIFRNLGIPLIQGRDFTAGDTTASPLTIVISREMARKYWPNESPLGKRMKIGRRDSAPWLTVVGVVGDLNHAALQDEEYPGPDVYLSAFQMAPLITPQLIFLLRTTDTPPLALIPAVEATVRSVAPDLPPYDPATMQSRLDRFSAKRRFLVFLMSLYAGLAVALAMLGLYGVLYYIVTQRTRELGIRMALGANTRDVFLLVIGKAAVLAAAGLAIGLAAAAGLNRLFQSLLYGVDPHDLLTYAGTALLLFLIAMAAAYLPARRAMKLETTVALKSE